MKRLLFIAAMLVSLTSCTLRDSSRPDGAVSKKSDDMSFVTVAEKRYSTEVPEGWTENEQDGKLYYISPDGRQGLMLNGVSPDLGMTAEEGLEAFKENFGETVYSPLSDALSDSDGTEYRIACLDIGNNMLMETIFCEERGTIISLTGQFTDSALSDGTYQLLLHMAENIEFNDMPDLISGNSFRSESSYERINEFSADGSFITYIDESSRDNDYVSGTYEVVQGMDAVDRVDSMTEYGLTHDEQVQIINSRERFPDQYYAVIFTPLDAVSSGEKVEFPDGQIILYVGTMNDDGTLSMTNCNSFSEEVWTAE